MAELYPPGFKMRKSCGRTVRKLTVALVGLALGVSLGAGEAAGQSFPAGSARVMRAVGRVSVMRDQQAWALGAGDPVKLKETIVTGPDGYATFEILSDHSTFDVFPNSHVVFRANPGNWADVLDVILGKIKVHIEKIGGKPNPASVRTPTAIISVRGTTFDVDVQDEGYATQVVVEEGVVGVRHALLPFGGERMLMEGDYITVYRNEPMARKSFDRGGAVRKALRVAVDLLVQMPRGMGSTPGTGGTGTGGGTTSGGGVGDTGADTPPAAPPPDN
jgi:ferric-dicitrate binding protein FerR (iron transport regulator)